MINHYSRRGKGRKNKNNFRSLFSIVATVAIVFYQIFLPFALIKVNAEEVATVNENANASSNESEENTNSNDNQSKEEDKNDNNNRNDNANDNKTDSSSNAQDENDCDVKERDLTDYCQEDLKCGSIDKCLKEYTCGEIKKCLSVRVGNSNNSNVNDNVNTKANSGENAITQGSNANANNNSGDPLIPNETASAQDDNRVGLAEEESNSQDNNGGDTSNDTNIDTGDAVAGSNVYNEVNTNIVSNNYQKTVINIEGTSDEDVNLLEQFQTLLEQNQADSPSGSLVVSNENIAEVNNDISVDANSGENVIETKRAGDTSAAIQTGDATALSNTANVVNTNIIGNNVLFAVVNVYGEWNGDLIVPGEGLLEVTPEPNYAETVIVNENKAEVENNVTAEAATGENSINQEGANNEAAVVSGAAYAGSEVLNIVSTHIVQNNFFFLLINNLGSWTGKILNWNEESGEYSNVFSYDFGILGDGETPTIDGILAIFNKNSATVTNNVNVSANTGGNTIEAEGSGNQALIETGNAVAMAKIVNFINTNIIGNNWIFAIVNIMGQWNGNTVFAYPDLTVSISDGKDQVGPGENLSYTVAYKNNGKAACDNANIMVSLPSLVSSADNLTYDLAGLKPGEEKSFTVAGVVSNDIPEGSTNLEALVGINTGTKEVELGNNLSKDDTTAYRVTYAPTDNNQPTNESLANAGDQESAPKLTINRGVKDSRVHAGDTVTYNIYIENSGNRDLYNVMVFDEMTLGKATVATVSWNVGDIEKGKKYRIQYKLAINKLAPAGVYRSTASGFGYDPANNKVEANKDSQKVTVLGNNVENVAYTQEYYNNGNFFQYTDSTVTAGICFLDVWPALSQAQAAENPTFLAGTEDNPFFPLWGWLMAAAAYFLAINWSFFPRRK